MSGLVDHTRTSGTGSGLPEPVVEASVNRLSDARQRRLAARSRVLSELMRERAEHQGVHGPADLAFESVRWCV